MDYAKINDLMQTRFFPYHTADFSKLGFKIAERSTKKNGTGLTAKDGRKLLEYQFSAAFAFYQKMLFTEDKMQTADQLEINAAFGNIVHNGFKKFFKKTITQCGILGITLDLVNRIWPDRDQKERTGFAMEISVAQLMGFFAVIRNNYIDPEDIIFKPFLSDADKVAMYKMMAEEYPDSAYAIWLKQQQANSDAVDAI